MSNRSLNKVILIGNMTRDPELRYTPQGTPVCSFGLATNRTWVDANNQRQEATEFHRIVAWQKLAELCSQLLFKGRKVYVEGRLQTRSWTSTDGQERTSTEVVIDNMIVLDSRRREGEMMGESAPVQPVPPVKKTVADEISHDTNQPAVTTDDSSVPPKSPAKTGAKSKTKKKEEKEEEPKEEIKEVKATDNEEVKAEDIPF